MISDLLNTLKEKFAVEITELEHAYRINGILDVWNKHNTVYDIVENKYEKIYGDDNLLNWIVERINKHPKRDPFKKTKKGRISMQEFRHSMNRLK